MMPAGELRVTVIRDGRELARMRDEWNTLLRTSASDNLFLTWEWVSTWWQTYGPPSGLYILAAHEPGGRLVGLAPLKIAARGVPGLWTVNAVEFIGLGGDVTPEYLDLLAAPGCERGVVDAFVEQLQNDPDVQIIDLRPFAASSPHLARVREGLRAGGGLVRCSTDSTCPVLELPSSPEAFMASRTRNYRKKIKEAERRCERDFQAALKICRTPDDLRVDLAALKDLHTRRWSGESRAFQSRAYVDFHWRVGQLFLDQGWLRLFTLTRGEEALAVLYCFSYNGRYYYYQAGRNPRFPKHRFGLVLMHKVIQEAIRERASVFDFLRGEEPYKFQWATSCLANTRVVCWKHLPAWIASGADTLVMRLRAVSTGSGGVPGRAAFQRMAQGAWSMAAAANFVTWALSSWARRR